MHPILFTIGPITLYSYGAMLVVASLTAIWLAARAARTLPPQLMAISPEPIVDFACVSLLGGILGGRLLYVLLQWRFFLSSPMELLALWHGGLVWYGGFLGGLLAGWLYVRSQRLAFLRVLDQFIPFLVLGHAIGRIGCFLNGCCYGKPTTSWCGVVFPGHTEAVIPTQLLESGGLFLLFLSLRRLQRPWMLNRPGSLFSLYLISYGLLRFLIEFLRGDQTAWRLGLTLQQFISLGAVAVGIGMLRTVRRRSDGAHVSIPARSGGSRTAA